MIEVEIYTGMTGSSAVTAYVSSANMFYAVLPKNHSKSSDTIVFNTSISTSYDTLDDINYANDYTVNFKILSTNSENVFTIAELLKDLFLSYTSSNVRKVQFERQNYLYDEFRDVETLNLDFTFYYDWD